MVKETFKDICDTFLGSPWKPMIMFGFIVLSMPGTLEENSSLVFQWPVGATLIVCGLWSKIGPILNLKVNDNPRNTEGEHR